MFKNADDFGDEIGWNVNGSIEAPIAANKTISLNGFWASIDDKDSARCDHGDSVRCEWFALGNDPAVLEVLNTLKGESILSDAEREVDRWGISLEVKKQIGPSVSGVTKAPPRRYLALGADVRGIDQDLDVNLRWITAFTIGPATYTEELDTRYNGLTDSYGWDIDPFLFKGMWQRWGLHSSFRLRGGIYYADTDYSGRIVDQTVGFNNMSSALALR